MSAPQINQQPLVEAYAGLAAGIAATLVAHPLDLVKTRLQGDFSFLTWDTLLMR